jgi:hypothetical protein
VNNTRLFGWAAVVIYWDLGGGLVVESSTLITFTNARGKLISSPYQKWLISASAAESARKPK